jgi:hypothetical protein
MRKSGRCRRQSTHSLSPIRDANSAVSIKAADTAIFLD